VGRIRPPRPAKLICGLIGGDVDLLARARNLLAKQIGQVEAVSDIWPFDQTDYYEHEMGRGLKRQFLSFAGLVQVDRLAEIKRLTNQIEQRITEDVLDPDIPRPVNLDPGYITLSKLVLASTKDYSHRIYLQAGIYAEVTLHYESGGWQAWPWTYPDYAAPTYHAFFTQVRQALKDQLSADPESGPHQAAPKA
jgi:hypothetical protein